MEGWIVGFCASFFIVSFFLIFKAISEKSNIGFYISLVICGLTFVFLVRAFYDVLGGL